jgi:Ca-activated chloride channel family protein
MLLPLLVIWEWWRRRRRPVLRFSSLEGIARRMPTWPTRLRRMLFGGRLLALGLLTVAVARPQWGFTETDITTEGVDIVITLDVSGSMAAEDFRPKNRLFVAKEVVRSFIEGRESDRIGLVVFSAESFTKCPLTLDYGILLRQLEDARLGTIRDGTAIGTALATSVNRLKVSKARSKVLILITDGVNNTGEIDPQTAAEIARAMKIKIYAVGVGRRGVAPFPVDDGFGGKRYVSMQVEIDEAGLQKISATTEGRYFRAEDPDSLKEIFRTIDRLEKTEIKAKSFTHYNELFGWFAWAALALLLLEAVLIHTRLRSLPL